MTFCPPLRPDQTSHVRPYRSADELTASQISQAIVEERERTHLGVTEMPGCAISQPIVVITIRPAAAKHSDTRPVNNAQSSAFTFGVKR
jgi:hypothetical protein